MVTIFTDSDYYPYPRSVIFNQGITDISFTVHTLHDRTLESREEKFSVAAKYNLQPNNTNDCDTTTIIKIIDDDGMFLINRY